VLNNDIPHAQLDLRLWDAIGHIIDPFAPSECANYFRNDVKQSVGLAAPNLAELEVDGEARFSNFMQFAD
jgi:hypothetical protein